MGVIKLKLSISNKSSIHCNMEFYKSRNLDKKTSKRYPKSDRRPTRSFRNSRDDKPSSYSRNHNRTEQSTTVVCSDCGITCNVPFIPRNSKPIYCNDCFKQDRFNDSDDSRHSRDNNSSRHRSYNRTEQSTTVVCSDCGTKCNVPFIPRNNKPIYCNDCFKQDRFNDSDDSRHSRDNNSSRHSHKNESSSRSKSKKLTDKSLQKRERFFSNGSDKFYKTIQEKLFEILGGKICSNCGFRDERALKISSIYGDTLDDDNNKRGTFASSLGKYISDPKTARDELKVLCLNCNQIREPLSKPDKGHIKPKKSKYFPR